MNAITHFFSRALIGFLVAVLLGGCTVINRKADGSATEIRIMDPVVTYAAPVRQAVPIDYYDRRYYRIYGVPRVAVPHFHVHRPTLVEPLPPNRRPCTEAELQRAPTGHCRRSR